MLGRLGWWRHALVASSIAVCGALAALGFIGTGVHDERFEAKQVVVEPAGTDGVLITEVVDIDFGNERRHGYERFIPNDFGVPIDVTASSTDAPDDVDVTVLGSETRIRLGDPDTTVSGQHRYVLRYTLPAAQVSSGELALDIIGNDETLRTERFEVIVTGFDLADPLCNVGRFGTSGGCALEREHDVYRAVIAPLEPGDGITISGTIVGVVAATDVAVDPAPARRDDARVPVTVGIVALGASGAMAVFGWARRKGRNEVFGGGGAADAAFGSLPRPGVAAVPLASQTTLVTDDRMATLATIEFVPPPGVQPWQGAVVLSERLDDDAVAAWFSGLAAAGVIEIVEVDDALEIRPGPNRSSTDAPTTAIVDTMFHGRERLQLGKYDQHFAAAWGAVRSAQRRAIAESGWWKHLPPSSPKGGSGAIFFVLVFVAFAVFGIGTTVSAALGAFRSVPLALLFGLVVPSVTAWCMYSTLLPARSGTGSALALRTESFRRFLAASEGKHVDWAWQQGLLREYSAWAVSLGAADAWGKALANSNVPAPEVRMNRPLLLPSMRSRMTSSRTKPSSSGSGGGSRGGFSGGRVGGGGGGGRSGSW